MEIYLEKEYNECICQITINTLKEHTLRDYVFKVLESSNWLDVFINYLRKETTIFNNTLIIEDKYEEILYRLSLLFQDSVHDNLNKVKDAFTFIKEYLDNIFYNDTILKASGVYICIDDNWYISKVNINFGIGSLNLSRSNEFEFITITLEGEHGYA